MQNKQVDPFFVSVQEQRNKKNLTLYRYWGTVNIVPIPLKYIFKNEK